MILESGTLLVSSSRWTWLDIKHVGVEAKSITLAIMLQAFQVGDAVLVIMKSSLLLIATDNHMVERSVILDSGLACHRSDSTSEERR